MIDHPIKMPKRRPTAADRDTAEAIRNLQPGRYSILVEAQDDMLQHCGLAQLKTEGSTQIMIYGLGADKIVHIVPIQRSGED